MSSNIFNRRGFLASSVFLILINVNLFGINLILENENQIIEKITEDKINEIGGEVEAKTDISVYLILKESIKEKNLQLYLDANYKDKLKQPYVVYMMSKERKLIDIFVSSYLLEDYFDKDDIIYDYTLPIIVTPSKASEQSLYSAGFLNGYSQLCEDIADEKGIELSNAIGNDNKDVFNVLRLLFYGTVAVFLVMYIRKKFWKAS